VQTPKALRAAGQVLQKAKMSEKLSTVLNPFHERGPPMSQEIVKANTVVFIASFCTLVIELVAGRIMAPYVGVSLYTWTSIIGIVLAGISVGAYLGGRLADRYPRSSTLGWLLLLSGVGAFSIAPLITLLGPVQWNVSFMVRILLITTLVFFAPSCLLGMISPVVVKLALDNLDKTGNVVGRIYAFSTLGSILGTFATGFFLIQWMGTRQILFLMGMILILSGLVFGGLFRRKEAFAVLFLLALPFTPALRGYALRPPLGEETYFLKESNYYTIKLKKTPSQRGDHLLEALVLDNLIHSYTHIHDPLHLEYDYLRTYEALIKWQAGFRPSFKTLFIGGGGYTFPRYVETLYPQAEIDVVEIDPEVTRVVRRFLGVPEESRIRSYNEDGRWFVMNTTGKEKYDFIFGDAFNDLSIPFHLTTKEFAQELKRILKPDGLLMTNVIDNMRKGLFLPSYLRTLEEAFGEGHVHLITEDTEFGDLGTSTYIVVASPKKIDMAGFEKVVKESDQGSSHLRVFPDYLLREYLKTPGVVVLTDDYVPVDNLIAPIFEERFGYRRNQ
jgi:spermidine synthase